MQTFKRSRGQSCDPLWSGAEAATPHDRECSRTGIHGRNTSAIAAPDAAIAVVATAVAAVVVIVDALLVVIPGVLMSLSSYSWSFPLASPPSLAPLSLSLLALLVDVIAATTVAVAVAVAVVVVVVVVSSLPAWLSSSWLTSRLSSVCSCKALQEMLAFHCHRFRILAPSCSR